MADSSEVNEEVSAEEVAPEGPDLSSLDSEGRALLTDALVVLERYDPQPSTLGDLPQVTVDRQYIRDACQRMKDDERVNAKMLLCLAALDYPPSSGSAPRGRHGAAEAEEASEEGPEPIGRLEVVYFLQSLDPERTLAIRTEAPYDDPVVPSVTPVWRAADWYEREAHDLYGVSFDGHPDLSPLLLYDEFEGHPGRKDFPFYEYREF